MAMGWENGLNFIHWVCFKAKWQKLERCLDRLDRLSIGHWTTIYIGYISKTQKGVGVIWEHVVWTHICCIWCIFKTAPHYNPPTIKKGGHQVMYYTDRSAFNTVYHGNMTKTH